MPNEPTDLAIAKILSVDPETWIRVAVFLYKKITERKPLSNNDKDINYQDLRLYRTLCTLYQNTLNTTCYPPEWALDENGCPTHNTKLADNATEFKGFCEKLQHGDYSLKTSIIKIVALMESLFISLSKRSLNYGYRNYRQDGQEAMFFTELAQWLSVDLPQYDITKQRTADLVLARIKYCEQVQENVLVYRDDGDKSNPKNHLERILTDLRILHKDILKSVRAATFNEHMNSINRDLKDMLTHALDICYLTIEGVTRRELQVHQWLGTIPQ